VGVIVNLINVGEAFEAKFKLEAFLALVARSVYTLS